MEHSKKAVKTISYVAGILVIISALMVTILMIMSALGMFYPRKTKIVLQTDTIEKVYDEGYVSCTEPYIVYGSLHDGHKLVVTKLQKFDKAGVYVNEPSFMIVDASGDNVTDAYAIEKAFGQIIIYGKPIIIASPYKNKVYDGKPLVSDEYVIKAGSLLPGHTLDSGARTSITEPGEIAIKPGYKIYNGKGIDVTDQYDIVDNSGTLLVTQIQLSVQTNSKEKNYDGAALTYENWSKINAPLLPGHTLTMKGFTSIDTVGSCANEATPIVTNEAGQDVTHLYNVKIKTGTLKINPIPLEISTGSSKKEYDGNAMTNKQYEIKVGSLMPGDRITVTDAAKLVNTGYVDNKLTFQIVNANNQDVTDCYSIKMLAGKLEITPRSITIRTGSATKAYDGTPLVCETYEIIKGKLCEGESLSMAFTSLINVGYTPNYVISCRVQKSNENGGTVDITSNYSITYDYGQLKVTG